MSDQVQMYYLSSGYILGEFTYMKKTLPSTIEYACECAFYKYTSIAILTSRLLLSTDVEQTLFHLNPSPVLSPPLIFPSPSQH